MCDTYMILETEQRTQKLNRILDEQTHKQTRVDDS